MQLFSVQAVGTPEKIQIPNFHFPNINTTFVQANMQCGSPPPSRKSENKNKNKYKKKHIRLEREKRDEGLTERDKILFFYCL